ncbi:MAG: SEC-C domain-containing protein [archaeon]|nr:MAG: SEC-C domain-containing protein [archaeon]
MYEEGFQPPSNRNFIDFTPETYRTSYADNGLKHRRGKFCPLGSYTNRQVRKKVENTSLVNSLGLKSLLVPKIEAYGRYLDENLRDEDGQFGFVVYSVPSDKRVAGSELEEEFAEMMGLTESGDPTKVIATLLRKYTKNLMGGLKELHDKGYCHLQGHMGQFYDFPERPYLVDWETMIPLGRTVQDRLLNREIDISKPLSSVWRMMGKSQTSGEEAMEFVNQVKPYLLGDYLGISPDQISKDRRAAMIRLSKGRRGVMVMEDDVSGLVLQKHGIERSPLKKNQAKIGRNDPCPCGSGIKFKKCCGGHK